MNFFFFPCMFWPHRILSNFNVAFVLKFRKHVILMIYPWKAQPLLDWIFLSTVIFNLCTFKVILMLVRATRYSTHYLSAILLFVHCLEECRFMPIYNLINKLILVWFSLAVLNLCQLFISHFYIKSFPCFRNKHVLLNIAFQNFLNDGNVIGHSTVPFYNTGHLAIMTTVLSQHLNDFLFRSIYLSEMNVNIQCRWLGFQLSCILFIGIHAIL